MVGQKVFLFKMLFYGPANGVDLVRRMQPSGDLQNCWLMFDRVKRVQEWTTMAYHVTTWCTTKCSTLQFATCNLNPQKLCVSCGKNWIRWCSSLVLQTPISKGSWWIMHMPVGMLFVSCIDLEMPMYVKMVNKEWTCSFHWT